MSGYWKIFVKIAILQANDKWKSLVFEIFLYFKDLAKKKKKILDCVIFMVDDIAFLYCCDIFLELRWTTLTSRIIELGKIFLIILIMYKEK